MQIFAKVKKILNYAPSEKLNVNFCKSENKKIYPFCD